MENAAISSSIITGGFTIMGVVLGFIGLYISNHLNFRNLRKKAQYETTYQKYQELTQLYNNFRQNYITFQATYRLLLVEEIDKEKMEQFEQMFNQIHQVNYAIKDYIKDNQFLLEQNAMSMENILVNLKESDYCLSFLQQLEIYFCMPHIFQKEDFQKAIEEYSVFLCAFSKEVAVIKTKLEQKIYQEKI